MESLSFVLLSAGFLPSLISRPMLPHIRHGLGILRFGALDGLWLTIGTCFNDLNALNFERSSTVVNLMCFEGLRVDRESYSLIIIKFMIPYSIVQIVQYSNVCSVYLEEVTEQLWPNRSNCLWLLCQCHGGRGANSRGSSSSQWCRAIPTGRCWAAHFRGRVVINHQ